MKKTALPSPYPLEKFEPVLRTFICIGEMTACFRNCETGILNEIIVIRSPKVFMTLGNTVSLNFQWFLTLNRIEGFSLPEKMTAKEAISLYKSRDVSEKLFSGDKSCLGNKSVRVYSDESVSAKIFIEFIALIIRSRIVRSLDGNYRIDHAVTAIQKGILDAFGIDAAYIKRKAALINNKLTEKNK